MTAWPLLHAICAYETWMRTGAYSATGPTGSAWFPPGFWHSLTACGLAYSAKAVRIAACGVRRCKRLALLALAYGVRWHWRRPASARLLAAACKRTSQATGSLALCTPVLIFAFTHTHRFRRLNISIAPEEGTALISLTNITCYLCWFPVQDSPARIRPIWLHAPPCALWCPDGQVAGGTLSSSTGQRRNTCTSFGVVQSRGGSLMNNGLWALQMALLSRCGAAGLRLSRHIASPRAEIQVYRGVSLTQCLLRKDGLFCCVFS
jgi:hypothetical protein